jgi:hypothetical protein
MTNGIAQQFNKSFKWTLSGSILYEACKATHCLLLLKCMPTALYGAMGSVFSLIYLVTYIADLGATNSLPPFLHILNKSKANFATFITRYSMTPHLPILFISAGFATFFMTTKFTTLPWLWLIPSLIILEMIRTFLRMLLHSTFLSKRVVIIELSIFALYLAITWAGILYSTGPVTLNHIFIPHFIDSALCVILFVILVVQYQKTLPNKPLSLPPALHKRLAKTKLFNYLLRVTRNMFTSNFLTPFFALRFGLASAGTFYVASMMVNGLQAIVKSAIGYSGNALLANLKEADENTKRQAFTTITNKLMGIIAPVIIVIGFNFKNILIISHQQSIQSETIALMLLCLFMSFTEFFFLLYEQFYIIEEAASSLFIFKCIELIAIYCFIQHGGISLPATLLGFIVIRLFSFFAIATNAWYTWRINLRLKTNKWLISSSAIIAICIAILVHWYNLGI